MMFCIRGSLIVTIWSVLRRIAFGVVIRSMARLLQAVRVKGGRDRKEFRRALESRLHPMVGRDRGACKPEDPLGAVMAFYLSMGHREKKMDGCPIVALGTDAARQGSDVKASFEAGIKAHLEVLGRLVAQTNDSEPKGKAMAVLSMMVGAVTLSRTVNDPDLAQAFLDAAADRFREVVAS